MDSLRFPRPTSITFIGRFLAIWAGVKLFLLLQFLIRFRMDDIFWVVNWALSGIILCVICGTYILRGDNWARVLYLCVLLPCSVVLPILAFASRVPSRYEDISSAPATVVAESIVYMALWALMVSRDANFFFIGRSTFFKKRKKPENNNPYEKDRAREFDY